MKKLIIGGLVVVGLVGLFFGITYRPDRATDNTTPIVTPIIPAITPNIPDVLPVKRVVPASPFDEGVVIRSERILPNGERLVVVNYDGRSYVMRSGDNVTWY